VFQHSGNTHWSPVAAVRLAVIKDEYTQRFVAIATWRQIDADFSLRARKYFTLIPLLVGMNLTFEIARSLRFWTRVIVNITNRCQRLIDR
jgi:hypothetical protein